jgi:hypothetical protein
MTFDEWWAGLKTRQIVNRKNLARMAYNEGQKNAGCSYCMTDEELEDFHAKWRGEQNGNS